ncbi:hypothetical protein L484_023010 [Morus notabilis]|uniref:Uncharacterized protein n=1 Tax=Morus notabilis TaxID=981085 RepID=W9RT95_9ROSA|nr:hypothetical protein L484_023010 [Morus notabilis]
MEDRTTIIGRIMGAITRGRTNRANLTRTTVKGDNPQNKQPKVWENAYVKMPSGHQSVLQLRS